MEKMKDFVENVLDSYEKRVEVVSTVMRQTTELLKRLSQEQARMAWELRERLAKKESLRKKDFDSLLEDIVIRQLDKEKKIVKVLNDFQREEEGLIARLRSILTGSEKVTLSAFRELSEEVLDRLKEKEKEASNMLRSFHIAQEELSAELKRLVEKGEEVRTKDFKAMIESLRLRQREKESEIGRLLDEFGKVQEEVNLRWEQVVKSYL